MRACTLLALTICVLVASANTQEKKSSSAQNNIAHDQRGTEDSPIVVKIAPAPKAQAESPQEAKDRQDKTTNDRKIAEFTGDLVTATYVLAAIGILQLMVFGYQAYQLRRTVESSADQSEAMERSIRESTRSATAMEKIAVDIEKSSQAAIDSVAALKERTAQQMRAYIAVIVGGGIYQERGKNLKFQGKPVIRNTGHTPAYKVTHIAKAAILPVPLPDDFDFPLTATPFGQGVLGAQQEAVLGPVVDDFCVDAEVDYIKTGAGVKALYVWGLVHYEDVFDQPHDTRFCQIITWLPDNTIWGYYAPRHNDAD